MANFNFAAEINSFFLGVPGPDRKSFPVTNGGFYIHTHGKKNPGNAVFPHKVGNVKSDVFKMFFGDNDNYALESGKGERSVFVLCSGVGPEDIALFKFHSLCLFPFTP